MTVSNRLIDCAADIWAQYDAHPFVRGIGDGTLPEEKFRFYMVQDYLYLIEYAKVFSLGAAKAHDLQTMRAFADYAHRLLNGEMDIHRAYMKRLGICLADAENTRAATANVSYTSYMLSVAHQDGPAEIAAAIFACAVSYERIARHLVAANPACTQHAFYGAWVSAYADEDYSRSNAALSQLIDRLTAAYSEAQIEHLQQLVRRCSIYEKQFWDMAWKMER